MILGHSTDEIKKTAVALVVSLAALVALYVQFDPNLTTAIQAAVLAAINVVAVFNAPRHSYSDVSKTLVALVVSGLALAAFFHQFNPGETEQIVAAVVAALNVGGVFLVKNLPTGQ